MSNWYQPFSWGASITSSQRSGYIEQDEVILKILQREFSGSSCRVLRRGCRIAHIRRCGCS